MTLEEQIADQEEELKLVQNILNNLYQEKLKRDLKGVTEVEEQVRIWLESKAPKKEDHALLHLSVPEDPPYKVKRLEGTKHEYESDIYPDLGDYLADALEPNRREVITAERIIDAIYDDYEYSQLSKLSKEKKDAYAKALMDKNIGSYVFDW